MTARLPARLHARPRPLAPLAALVAATLLGACSRTPAGADYFPLDSGRRWVYQQRSEWSDQRVDDESVELRAFGEETLPDGSRAWRRRSASGMEYWLRIEPAAIVRVAARSDAQPEPQKDPAPRTVLPLPPVLGAQWQASTTAYLLRRRNEFPPEIRHSHAPVTMNYTLEALDETVTTPAGEFRRCLRVKGVAQLRLFADPVAGWRDLPLTTLEWYCPGVGLVRLSRDEPADSTFLVGGRLTMELNEWQ